ncbi:VOC family protein [Sedimenticola sp.]|uniref:VOC family protein n=1 Tax=Sedimenticola sp. TaxID=1940285 RepID=UPI003D0C6AC0
MTRQATHGTDTQPVTQGIHHLGLTVPNVSETAHFFIEHLRFSAVGEKPDYPTIFVSDGAIMLTLWQTTAEKTVAFDRTANVGLHHFALKVAGIEQLLQLHEKLSLLDEVEIEFAPEPLSGTPIQHMMCHIPGGLRVEFLALPEEAK